MFGFILKIGFIGIVIMVALNVFAPNQANKILTVVSEKTQIEENTLKDNLNKATEFTKDTVSEVSQTIQKKLEE